MDAKTFLIEKMNEFITLFPDTRLRYDYHLLSNSHTIEVVPSKIYNTDLSYKTWEENIIFEFIDHFPEESLSLVTDDSLFGIDKVDLEFIGTNYDKAPTVVYDDLYLAKLKTLQEKLLNLFNAYHATLDKHPKVTLKTELKDVWKIQSSQMHITCKTSANNETIQALPENLETTDYGQAGENNYALAA